MSVNRVLLGLIGANIMGSLSPPLFADAFNFVEPLPGEEHQSTVFGVVVPHFSTSDSITCRSA